MTESNNNKKIFICDRRDLLKWTAATSAAMMFIDLDQMYAAGAADLFSDNIAPADKFSPASNELFQWIDGPFATQFGTGFEAGITRVKLAVMVSLPHTPDSFVESVLVTDSDRNIIARQNFVPGQATSKGRAPYAIFDNIALDPTKSYFIYYVINKKTTSVVYRFTLAKEKVRQSRLDYEHLNARAREQIPPEFILDMNDKTQHMFDGLPELGEGYMTTPYQRFAELPLHNVRYKVKSLAKDGKFEFHIGKMHGDVSDAHYMRYFIVLDPVGRVLGGLRRKFGDPDAGLAFHSIKNELVGFMPSDVGAKPSDLNIADCPYVQILTEDKADAMSRMTFRLR